MNQVDKKKILIVDDELSVRHVLRKMLSKNYIVLEAEDGEEAVNMARKEKPDLVLMDLLMPKKAGYTSCHVIKADPATKVIPVVILTAVDHELSVKLGQELGADGIYNQAVPFTGCTGLRQLIFTKRDFSRLGGFIYANRNRWAEVLQNFGSVQGDRH